LERRSTFGLSSFIITNTIGVFYVHYRNNLNLMIY